MGAIGVVRPKLGEILLAQGLCRREHLREAWEQKILFGDRLGTNLLALGYIDEGTLSRALGAQHGVHSGEGRVLQVDPEAVALLPKNVAARRFVVPHHAVQHGGQRALFLLMRDPHDAHALEDAAFATGMKIIPIVVTEARIWQLLEKHYGVHASFRPIRLDGVVRAAPMALPKETTDLELSADLVSEEEFQRLYASARPLPVSLPPPIAAADDDDSALDRTAPSGVRPGFRIDDFPSMDGAADGAQSPLSVLSPPLSADGVEWRDPSHPDLRWRDVVEKTNPMLALPRLKSEDDALPLIDIVELGPTIPPELAPQPTQELVVDRAALEDEAPLELAAASEALRSAEDRRAIGMLVLRAARSRFARACLLTVYPDRFVGWLGVGDGLTTERVQEIAIARAEKSVFSLVADSRAHYLGPLARWPAHGGWVKATGRKLPKSVAVFPILVRGRPVNLLYVDNGHGGHVTAEMLGEVLILAQQISRSYESLLQGRA